MSWGLVGIGAGGDGADDEPWEAVGFEVTDGVVALANGAVLFGRSGLVVHRIGEVEPVETPTFLDGIPVAMAEHPLATAHHPNGAVELDHVVVMTDSLERTSAAVEEALGLPRRRIRETEQVRQAFHRFPDAGGSRGCIVEVVESPRATGSAIWGIVVNVDDLDATWRRLGPELIGSQKPAVQPGRSIATVRREAGLPLALAFMSR